MSEGDVRGGAAAPTRHKGPQGHRREHRHLRHDRLAGEARANNNGRVGMWGISYPGFYVAAGMIDAHPALKAVSPQAPVTDYFLGDDVYHNGAFMLAANFGFYSTSCRAAEPDEAASRQSAFDYGTPDGYDFFLQTRCRWPACNAELLRRQAAYWQDDRRSHRPTTTSGSARILRHFMNERQPRGADRGRLVRRRGSGRAAAQSTARSRDRTRRRRTCS